MRISFEGAGKKEDDPLSFDVSERVHYNKVLTSVSHQIYI